MVLQNGTGESERRTPPTHLKLLELKERAHTYQTEINTKCFALRYVCVALAQSSERRQLDVRTASLA